MSFRLPSEELAEKARKLEKFNVLVEVLREGMAQAAVFRLLFDKYEYQPEGLKNGEIEAELRTMSQSVVSNALRKLRRKNIVHTRKESRCVFNFLTPESFKVMKELDIEPLVFN